jgi:hypothetical protein
MRESIIISPYSKVLFLKRLKLQGQKVTMRWNVTIHTCPPHNASQTFHVWTPGFTKKVAAKNHISCRDLQELYVWLNLK